MGLPMPWLFCFYLRRRTGQMRWNEASKNKLFLFLSVPSLPPFPSHAFSTPFLFLTPFFFHFLPFPTTTMVLSQNKDSNSIVIRSSAGMSDGLESRNVITFFKDSSPLRGTHIKKTTVLLVDHLKDCSIDAFMACFQICRVTWTK